MCLVFNANKEWRFAKHDEAMGSGEIIDGTKWNLHFSKINVPSKEKDKVLKLLDEHNLNAFSLFGSEESLMETRLPISTLQQLAVSSIFFVHSIGL